MDVKDEGDEEYNKSESENGNGQGDDGTNDEGGHTGDSFHCTGSEENRHRTNYVRGSGSWTLFLGGGVQLRAELRLSINHSMREMAEFAPKGGRCKLCREEAEA